MSIIGLNFSHILEQEDLPLSEPLLDCSDIVGTDCYCDDLAYTEIAARLASYSYDGIHFIDSGNYHYLSLQFLDKIPSEMSFELVVFDNHPDSQIPAFGQITSCGGWVREAWEKYPNLKKVTLIGVDPELMEEEGHLPGATEVEAGEREKVFEREVVVESVGTIDLPVYISIDKDVLCSEDASCNWSQGIMTLDGLLTRLKEIRQERTILGVDICGEELYSESGAGTKLNEKANLAMIDVLGK